MKSSHRHNYKALYNNCAEQSADKDELITLLQEQLVQLVAERVKDQALIKEQQQIITAQERQISQLTTQQVLQQETILSQAEQLEQQESLLTEQNNFITIQQKELKENRKEIGRLDQLQYELRMVKRWIYGINSEKRHRPEQVENNMDVKQGVLNLDVDSWGICRITDRKHIAAHLRLYKTIEPKKRGGRNELPEGLEEEVLVIDVPNRPPNARLVRYEETRQLACDPLRWYIKLIRRPVYLAPAEDELTFKQLIAPLPSHPIPRCKVDISVLVMLLLDKFLYHLPAWRQRQRFIQYGITLPYATLVYYINRTCDALEPLWHLLLKEIIISGYTQSDETTYKTLDNTKKKGKKSHLGWMWALMNPVQRICCFIYRPGRGRKDIKSVLKGYKGYLLTDDYGPYHYFGKQTGVKHQQCLSHVRRYFDRALPYDRKRAGYALDNFFAPLYAIEAEGKLLQLDYDAITEKRQTEATPILHALRLWLLQELPHTIERTPIHKAIVHALNCFEGLLVYTTDGMLQIDNNLLEGQIRSIALGRNNHLFAGSHRGAERAAIIYSLLATCKLQEVNAAKWLDDVLHRITDHPKEKLIELLPQYWKSPGQPVKAAAS